MIFLDLSFLEWNCCDELGEGYGLVFRVGFGIDKEFFRWEMKYDEGLILRILLIF